MTWLSIAFLAKVEPDLTPEEAKDEVEGVVEEMMSGQFDVLCDHYDLDNVEVRPFSEVFDLVLQQKKEQEQELGEVREKLRKKLRSDQDLDAMTAYEMLHFARHALCWLSHLTRVYNTEKHDHTIPAQYEPGWYAAFVNYHY